jgi:uncharacterized protein YjbI with pentapeptide repeats
MRWMRRRHIGRHVSVASGECDLAGAVLDGARFAGASLVRSNLAGASLLAPTSHTRISIAPIWRAQTRLRRPSSARLSGASMKLTSKAASLIGTLAARANLRGSVLEDAVLTSLRGEPLFSEFPDLPHAIASSGWPAARLGERQLAFPGSARQLPERSAGC